MPELNLAAELLRSANRCVSASVLARDNVHASVLGRSQNPEPPLGVTLSDDGDDFRGVHFATPWRQVWASGQATGSPDSQAARAALSWMSHCFHFQQSMSVTTSCSVFRTYVFVPSGRAARNVRLCVHRLIVNPPYSKVFASIFVALLFIVLSLSSGGGVGQLTVKASAASSSSRISSAAAILR